MTSNADSLNLKGRDHYRKRVGKGPLKHVPEEKVSACILSSEAFTVIFQIQNRDPLHLPYAKIKVTKL